MAELCAQPHGVDPQRLEELERRSKIERDSESPKRSSKSGKATDKLHRMFIKTLDGQEIELE